MKKFYGALMFVALAVFALSLSGCGGSSSKKFAGYTTTETVKQVAVLTSPAFEIGKDYQIYKGSSLTGMNGAQYYVADVGSESNKATLNLGFVDEINETLVFTNNGSVVFAYDPSGTEGSVLTEGTVTRTGGNLLSYNGLTIASAVSFTALDIDRTNVKTIALNGTSATYEGNAVKEYNYVWHSDPDHEDEYYTEGIDGIIEYTEDEILSKVSGDEVYIAHDIVYMPSGLEYTATVKNDEETEYAAYYSSSVQSSVAAKLGTGFEGPFIFATLPASTGGMPGGDGGTPPGGTSGDMGPGGGGTPPNMPSGDMGPGGGTPPNMPSGDRPALPANLRASSYNSQIASTIASMTHSSADAYANPVLHITQPGTYSFQGTWNGQIWIDLGDDTDEDAKVAVILNGVTVTCTVAPAIVFHDVYECGPDDETKVASTSMDVGKDLLDDAGAMVVIADGTTNNFTGANVYRMLKPAKKKDSVTTIDGTDVSQQKKRYKMDGAFYSFSSMAIGGEANATGVLNITSSTYEGLNTEMHATIESGTVNITAPDDAINVNEDYISVFTMLDGEMTIKSNNGDGIDSNGYVVLLGGSLDITAGNQSTAAAGEGGIDAESGIYIAPSVNYTHHSTSGGGGGDVTPPDGGNNSGDITPPDGGNNSGDVTPPDGGNNSGDVTPPDGGNNSGDITPPDGGNNSGDITPPTPSQDITPTPTPTPTPSQDVTPVPTPTPSQDITPTPTPTPSQDITPVPAPTPTPSQDVTPTPTPTPTPQVDDYTPPEDADESLYVETSRGTTEFNMAAGSTSSFIEADEDAATPRGISSSGSVFPLRRRVNTFSGIR